MKSMKDGINSMKLICIFFIILIFTVFSVSAQEVVRKKSLYGIQDGKGNWVLQPKYDNILRYKTQHTRYQSPYYYYVIDSAGKYRLKEISTTDFTGESISGIRWNRFDIPLCDTIYVADTRPYIEDEPGQYRLFFYRKENQLGYAVAYEFYCQASLPAYDSIKIIDQGEKYYLLELFKDGNSGLSFINGNETRAYEGRPELVVVEPSSHFIKTQPVKNRDNKLINTLYTVRTDRQGKKKLQFTDCVECYVMPLLKKNTKSFATQDAYDSIAPTRYGYLFAYYYNNKAGYLSVDQKNDSILALTEPIFDSLYYLGASLHGYHNGKLLNIQEFKKESDLQAKAMYDHTTPLRNDYTLTKNGQQSGLMYKNEKLLEAEYDKIEILATSDIFLVTKKGKSGIYSRTQGFILPVVYDDLNAFNSLDLILAKKDGKWGIHNKQAFILPVTFDTLEYYYLYTKYVIAADRNGYRLFNLTNAKFETDPPSKMIRYIYGWPLMVATKGAKMFFIDARNGQLISKTGFSSIHANLPGYLCASDGSQISIINQNAEIVATVQGDSVFAVFPKNPNLLAYTYRKKYYLKDLKNNSLANAATGFDKLEVIEDNCILTGTTGYAILNNEGIIKKYEQLTHLGQGIWHGISSTENNLHLQYGQIRELVKGEKFLYMVPGPDGRTDYVVTQKTGKGLIRIKSNSRIIYPDPAITDIRVSIKKFKNKDEYEEQVSIVMNDKLIECSFLTLGDKLEYFVSGTTRTCSYCSGGYITKYNTTNNEKTPVFGFGEYYSKDGSKHYGQYVKGYTGGGTTTTTSRSLCEHCKGAYVTSTGYTKTLTWNAATEKYR